jgi:hypothetical protein
MAEFTTAREDVLRILGDATTMAQAQEFVSVHVVLVYPSGSCEWFTSANTLEAIGALEMMKHQALAAGDTPEAEE